MNDAPTNIPETTREEFLTARQLAVILQVSERTIQRLAQSGRIPAMRITPRIMRFHLQAVCDALDAGNRPRVRRTVNEQSEDSQLSFTDLLWQPPIDNSHQKRAQAKNPRKKKRSASDSKSDR